MPTSIDLAADWIKPGLEAAESVKVSETVANPNLATVPLAVDGRTNELTESQAAPMPAPFSYAQAFDRNIGWVTEAEQASLRGRCVAIAGMGGVGGRHLLTLVRLGIGRVRLADFDTSCRAVCYTLAERRRSTASRTGSHRSRAPPRPTRRSSRERDAGAGAEGRRVQPAWFRVRPFWAPQGTQKLPACAARISVESLFCVEGGQLANQRWVSALISATRR